MASPATNGVFIALLLSLCLGMCLGQMTDDVMIQSPAPDGAPTMQPDLQLDDRCGCVCGSDDGGLCLPCPADNGDDVGRLINMDTAPIDPSEVNIFGGCQFVYDCLGVHDQTTLEELKQLIRELIAKLDHQPPSLDGIAPFSA